MSRQGSEPDSSQVKEIHDMFPNIDVDVIKELLKELPSQEEVIDRCIHDGEHLSFKTARVKGAPSKPKSSDRQKYGRKPKAIQPLYEAPKAAEQSKPAKEEPAPETHEISVPVPKPVSSVWSSLQLGATAPAAHQEPVRHEPAHNEPEQAPPGMPAPAAPQVAVPQPAAPVDVVPRPEYLPSDVKSKPEKVPEKVEKKEKSVPVYEAPIAPQPAPVELKNMLRVPAAISNMKSSGYRKFGCFDPKWVPIKNRPVPKPKIVISDVISEFHVNEVIAPVEKRAPSPQMYQQPIYFQPSYIPQQPGAVPTQYAFPPGQPFFPMPPYGPYTQVYTTRPPQVAPPMPAYGRPNQPQPPHQGRADEKAQPFYVSNKPANAEYDDQQPPRGF